MSYHYNSNGSFKGYSTKNSDGSRTHYRSNGSYSGYGPMSRFSTS